MPSVTRIQAGEFIAMWLQKSSDAAVVKQIVAETGYNDSPLFGAEKRRVRIMAEVVMLNTALAIFAVNQVFSVGDAKPVIDAFLASARKSVFGVIEAKDRTFGERYQQRMTEYFGVLQGERPALGISFAFLRNLELDPLKNLAGQMFVAQHFGQSLGETLNALKTMRLV
jgi:hypothetical protein